jgi:hypothetical protein
MVQVIENLTHISGRIVARRPHPSLADYDVVRLRIEHAQPVAGKADLLSSHAGTEMDVAVRRDLLGNAPAGAVLRCRAKRIPDGAMCEPHPEDADFSVTGASEAP